MEAEGLVALLVATISNEETKKRLEILRAAQEEHDAARLRLGEEISRNASILDETRRLTAAAAADKEELLGKVRELDERERALGEVSAGLNAEKSAWEKIRHRVDGEQAALKKALEEKDSLLSREADELSQRRRDFDDREKHLAAAEERHARKREALLAALGVS